MNLVEALEEACRLHGNKIAITHGDRHTTYAELNAESVRFAEALNTSGICPGDRVAMLLGNSSEFMVAYLGIVKTGAVAVLLDPKYKPDELATILSDCQPRMLLTETVALESLATHLEAFKFIHLVVNISHETCPGSIRYTDFMASSAGRLKQPQINDSDLAHIAYTSGPSFAPRGVMVPHGNLVEEMRISAGSFAQTGNDVVMQFALPLHHVIGLAVVMLTSLYCGSHVVILNGVSIESLAASIERHKATIFMGVPFIHAMLLRRVEAEGLKHDLSSLRVCASAGDILPSDIVERYQKELHLKLINLYGLTETMGHVTCEPLEGEYRSGSVGRALPGWSIKVADKNGAALPAGQAGEVIIGGPLMMGYYNNPQATAEVLKDGWLHTGDTGMLDENGYLYILGLQKDMLICKGQNIFPSDIEHVLLQHPSVAKAAAVGVPDKMRGEVVGAVVVFKNGMHASETALLKFCLERLANYKVPKYFAFWDILPETSSGKIDKPAIRTYFENHPRSGNAGD